MRCAPRCEIDRGRERGFCRPLDRSSAAFWSAFTAAGRAALAMVVNQQATMIAYIDDYKLLMIATLAVMPLLIVFRKPSAGGGHGRTMVVE